MRTSWQTLLADLALVLFIVTVGALVRARHAHLATISAPPQEVAPPSSAPLAIYRDGPGTPSLSAWLEQQPRDMRQQVTIEIDYRPGTERALSARVDAVIAAAQAAGARPRILIEPGEGGTSASVGFDAPPGAITPPARNLLSSDRANQHRITP